MIVLGIDPGFSNLGWCRARISRGSIDRVEMGLIGAKSSPDDGGKIRSLVRRVRTVCADMHRQMLFAGVSHVICEQISYVRSSTAMLQVGMSWGAIMAASVIRDIPLHAISARRVKEVVLGAKHGMSRQAGKLAVQSEMMRMYGHLGAGWGHQSTASHPYDALACIHAWMLDSPGLWMSEIVGGRVLRAVEGGDV